MKTKNILSIATIASSLMFSEAAMAKSENPWLVRVRAVQIMPDVDNRNKADGSNIRADIDTDLIPELDISYFFTKNIATELVLGTSKHGVSAGDINLGTVNLLPPTLTLQYHFNADNSFKPYVGAGLNYTIFYNSKAANNTYYKTEYQNSIGYALQAGFDYMIDDRFGLNFDVKKLYLSTDVNVNHGAVRAKVDIDPWLIGAGITVKF